MSNLQVAERYAKAHQETDWDTLGELIDADVEVTYPQSGETFRGRDDYLTMLRNYPGGLDTSELVVEETHGQKESVHVQAVPFGLPTITVSGAGNTFLFEGVVTYPDDSFFHFIAVIEFRDGLSFKETWYFAEPFDPPEWRAQYATG
jgi:hypothetical protein